MEDRTQIKFENPNIDGSTKPQLVTLEEANPIEGKGSRDDGSEFVWHKWLCTGNKYFLASPSLDGMLKMVSDRLGRVLKIEKVENPKQGGYPFFQIDGMNKDQIITQANVDRVVPSVNGMSTDIPSTDGSLARLEQKLDKIIDMLNIMKSNEDGLPL